MTLFGALVNAHLFFGVIGLVTFWAPVIAKKGGTLHRRAGFVFAYSMMTTGTIATGISFTTLSAPLETHPLLTDQALIEGQFGWLMLFLSLLTINLGWHTLATVRYKRNHRGHRGPVSIFLQVGVIVSALNCSWHGWGLDKPLLVGVGLIGVLAGVVMSTFMLSTNVEKTDYLHQHLRAGVGAGISAYTAVLSVSLVRFWPEQTFNPWLWSIPTVLGSTFIGYHEAKLFIARGRLRAAHKAASTASEATGSAAE